jgi:SecD/SecF fusion protein
MEIGALRTALTSVFGTTPIVKSVSTDNVYNITTSYMVDKTGPDVQGQVLAKLHEGVQTVVGPIEIEKFQDTDGTGTHIISSSQVGATVADDIRNSSFLAGGIALLLIFLYLLFRFRKWQFSMGAVGALFHDVIITLGFFSLLHGLVPFSLEIDQAIIACILTVIGFSVNDTVIVYDRIREYMGLFPGAPKQFVVNKAVNTTMSRTLITSGTTIGVALLLFIFGGDATKGFAFGMLVGLTIGTYSSIFVASALVIDTVKEPTLNDRTADTGKRKKKVDSAHAQQMLREAADMK